MKKIFIYLICLLSHLSYAQIHNKDAKRDNIWEVGYNGSTWNDSRWGINQISFTNNSPTQIRKDNKFIKYFRSAASICDTTGRFLFSTNGIYVYDATGNRMQGSNPICSGWWVTDFLNDGYAGPDACMILPAPEHPNLYYNIQACMLDSQLLPFFSTDLNYSIIDINGNNGLGAVVQQSQSIIANDSLDMGKVTACRHANGRDWWIVVWRGSEQVQNAYARILLDPTGLHFLGWGSPFGAKQASIGQALFSPDGTKHIRYYPYGRNTAADNCLDIFDFDRCTGEMTNYIPIRYMDSVYSAGAAVSPNSRYLYISVHNRIYQFDLQANDILASKITVANYDGFSETGNATGQTYFNTMRLAPDGKIYINCTNGVHYMHVIQNPDVGGIGCNVQQHGLQLLTYNLFAMPNFPHFRLGAQTGSGCDTLNVATASPSPSEAEDNIRIYPNPASNELNLSYPDFQNKQIIITDILGRTQKTASPSPSQVGETQTINIQNLPNGIYYLSIYENSRLLGSRKFVVLHE
jgi:Secretion system C-terminal sorting domain